MRRVQPSVQVGVGHSIRTGSRVAVAGSWAHGGAPGMGGEEVLSLVRCWMVLALTWSGAVASRA